MEHVHRVLVAVLVAACGGVPIAGAQQRPVGPVPVRIDGVGHGSLLFTAGDGRTRWAPNQSTDVEIVVRGIVAEARVTQRYSNPGDDWVEGTYVFPLPDRAAVHALHLDVGGRIIEGQIQERARAQRTYRAAKRQGKKASLVEQERPNIFTTSVANIGPGEVVTVSIRYQEILDYDAGRFELRFPMVVGPRFMPGSPVAEPDRGTGWAHDTDRVPDASRISPRVLHPTEGPVNPVSLRVSVDAGVRLESVACLSHVADIHRRRRSFKVALEGVPADRDFVLEWRPERGSEPRAAVFSEELDGSIYVLVMLMPPADDAVAAVRLPRETVFVIDTSGSMGGTSISQARQALELALDRLRPEDWFNVIAFSSSTRRLFRHSRPALPVHVDEARAWVRRLGADGGTRMMPALETALTDDETRTPLRQVVFITDGCVGNEDALFAAISAQLGRTRLFTVGIGSAPNAHFMDRAAAFGRGTATFISRPSEVAQRIGELFTKIEDPVLTDIEVAWPDPNAEMWPERVPDLYAGEPLVVTARVGTTHGRLMASGVLAGGGWETDATLKTASNRAGIDRLWARRKISALMDRRATGAGEDEVRRQVVDVALAHHLVSRYTSLVAVDVTPTRPMGVGVTTHPVPTNLPAGWRHETVLSSMPRGGTGARLHMLIGVLTLLVAVVLRLVPGGAR